MSVTNYFSLNEDPFDIGPDPRFLYMSDQVREAMAKLDYYIENRKGPVYMYGPIGSGKTTIVRRLSGQLGRQKQYTVCSLISPNAKTANAFLRLVMNGFGVKTARAYVQSLENFQSFLAEEYRADRVPILLVDEAQNLVRDSLKLVHYLLNFETDTEKLLQIVLVGQEELATRMLRYRELASRMLPIPIIPMTEGEMRQMIEFRWQVAGGRELPFRDDEIFSAVYRASQGIPRDAVKLCDSALIRVASERSDSISVQDIAELASALNLADIREGK